MILYLFMIVHILAFDTAYSLNFTLFEYACVIATYYVINRNLIKHHSHGNKYQTFILLNFFLINFLHIY